MNSKSGYRIPFLRLFSVAVIYLIFNTGPISAQTSNSFIQFNSKIDSLTKLQDTSGVTDVFYNGIQWAKQQHLAKTEVTFLEFRLSQTRHSLRYSKIAVDSAIAQYQEIYEDAKEAKSYLVQTKALGFMANAFRSKRELDKAFEYNQLEIETAELSNDRLILARALITELDIAYNSFPNPMKPSDLENLVTKAAYVISFSKENELNSTLGFGKLYLSKFYIKQGEYLLAKNILNSILDDEPLAITFSKYEHLCEIAKQTGNLKEYRAYTLAFKSRAYKTNRAFVALNAHNYLLDYSFKTNNQDSTLYYVQQLEHNLREVDTTKYLDFLDVTYTSLARYYKAKEPEKELQYLSYSAQINKVISRRQQEAFSAILKYNSELDQLEAANSDLSKTNSFFKNNLLASIGLALILAILTFIIFRKYKKSRRKTAEVLVEKQNIEQLVHKKYIDLNNKQRVYIDELKYLKADGNYVEYHTTEKRIVDRGLLSATSKELTPNFIQIHRSYVINKNFIKSSSSNQVILFPNICLPISRTFKSRLKEPV